MYCMNCGKQIDDNSLVCPYCGTPTNEAPDQQGSANPGPVQQQNYAQRQPNNTMAIVGFVLSFFVSLVGLIICIMAKKKSDEMDSTGRGLATAGIVISIISMVLTFILSIVYSIAILNML